MDRIVRTQEEVQELSEELKALLKEESVIGVEVKVIPVKGITNKQRELLLELIEEFGYDPEASALPQTSKDASRLIAYFLKRKGYGRRHRKKTSAQS